MGIRRAVLCLLLVALGFGLAPASTKTAAAFPTRWYETWFGPMVVDDEHRRVFLAGGRSDSSITVLDWRGGFVAEIEGLPYVGGMVISGSTLYATVPQENAIAVIDTTTFEIRERLSTEPYVGPNSLALANGKLWFALNHYCASSDFSLGSMDLITREVQNHGDLGAHFQCPIVSSSPDHPNVILVGDHGTPPVLTALDVTAGVRQLWVDRENGPGYLHPNGQHVLAEGEGRLRLLSLNDASQVRSYPMPLHNPTYAYAVSNDGRFVAATDHDSGYAIVHLFDAETSTLLATYPLFHCVPGSGSLLDVHRLSFSDDGTRLFAAVNSPWTGQHGRGQLHVMPTDPAAASLRLTVARNPVDSGEPVRMYVHLDHEARSSNKKVGIYATVQMHDGLRDVEVVSGEVNARGVYSARAPLWRNSRVWAQWIGDPVSHHCIETEAQPISVRPVVRGKIDRPRGDGRGVPTFKRGRSPRYVTGVEPAHPFHSLEIQVEESAGRSWTPIQQGIVGADERSTFEINHGLLRAGRRYRARGYIETHNDHLSGVSPWSYFEVRGR